VRDEGGFDRIKDIQFYNVAAFGLGYDTIKKPDQSPHAPRRFVVPHGKL